MKIKEGIARIIRKGETIIVIDENDNMFSTNDMFLMHLTKEKLDKYINQAKEKKNDKLI